MLNEFLSKQEGKTLEFRENTQNLKSILKSITAFANTAGGVILIGIKNQSKEIVGVADPLIEEEKLANTVADHISPYMVPSFEVTSYRNKALLIIRVPHLAGPHYLEQDGDEEGIYIRLGAKNRKADQETKKALRLLTSNRSFDELPSKGTIDEKYLKRIFRNVKKTPTIAQCQILGIYSSQYGKIKPSIGGLLLFSHEHVDILPESMIRCVCFRGETKAKVLDQAKILSPFPSAIEEIMGFIERNSKIEADLGKMKRGDFSQYPPEAVRELIINALMHADYSMKGSHIQIAMFQSRIEVTSPGGLPFGQTMEKALSGYSRLRNRVLGRVFKELKYINQWGSGIQRTLAICKKLGLKPPLFEEQDNHFKATLYSTKETQTHHSREELGLIHYLQKHGTVQTSQASKLWKLSGRAARTRLSKMMGEGVIVRISTSEKDPHAVYVLRKD